MQSAKSKPREILQQPSLFNKYTAKERKKKTENGKGKPID